MTTDTVTQATTLARAPAVSLMQHQTLRLNRALGLSIVVINGKLWITEENAGVDWFLTTGEALRLSTRGRTVIGAEQDARFLLCRPVPPVRAPWVKHLLRRFIPHLSSVSRASCAAR